MYVYRRYIQSLRRSYVVKHLAKHAQTGLEVHDCIHCLHLHDRAGTLASIYILQKTPLNWPASASCVDLFGPYIHNNNIDHPTVQKLCHHQANMLKNMICFLQISEVNSLDYYNLYITIA